MTTAMAEACFREVLCNLRDSIGESTVNLWFGKATITAGEDNTVTICAETLFKKNTIINRYMTRLEDGFFTAAGQRVRIRVTSRDEITEEEGDIFSDAKVEALPPEKQKPVTRSDISMYRDYTFENFVVGSSNKVAQSACLAVANDPVIRINPLFLYGSSGLGKTHLLFATINEAVHRKPDLNVIYVTGEQFTNEIIDSITSKSTTVFREKYRNVDMLLVDDIQFIAGKMVVQEEFFHTFDTLFKMGKQIVLTSDRTPKDIDLLEERLRTRFESGLIVDIQPPETELRTAIFKQKTLTLGLDIPNDVLTYLAENITSNVRQIEGAVKKLWAQSFITNEKITLEMAQTVLKDYFREHKPSITPEAIIALLEKRYGIPKEDILGRKRTAEIVYVRHIAIYLIIQESTDLSLKKIGKMFGKDHSTVISARDNVIKRMRTDSAFNREITEIRGELESR